MTELPRLFAVLGDPVAHSRSPAMMNAAFAALGLPHHYLPLRVRPADLPTAVAGLRAIGCGGFNVTVPHKRAIVGLLDELDPLAERIGAVNTVQWTGGRWRGHNTDGPGFMAGLAELGGDPVTTAVVLGSGGAARAVVAALLADDPDRAVHWISRDPNRIPGWPGVRAGTYADLGTVAAADLLVNATTVGMVGGPPDFPVPMPPALAAGARVVDLVYPRPPGGLLDRADAAGLRTQDGLPMLLWQGVRALEIWQWTVSVGVVAAMRAALGR